MAKINPDLLARLQKQLDVKAAQVYALISAKVRQTHLPRNLAAIALASERGINISRFATDIDLATIRQASGIPAPASVVVPVAPSEARASNKKGKGKAKKSASSPAAQRRGTTVFVVHGRDLDARNAMFEFLRAVGLRPLEWNQVIKLTGQPSPYVGTILETAFREAAAVVVLLTPDDEAKLKAQLQQQSDPAYEKQLTGQARPNVLFEAGMAFGRNPENTVLVQLGKIRPFSDVAGRHAVNMNNSPAKRNEFVTKLANAGCNVNIDGTDWLSAGNFTEGLDKKKGRAARP